MLPAGSAAFNVLCVLGACVVAVPEGSHKRVTDFGVYMYCNVIAVGAFVWVLIVYEPWSRDVRFQHPSMHIVPPMQSCRCATRQAALAVYAVHATSAQQVPSSCWKRPWLPSYLAAPTCICAHLNSPPSSNGQVPIPLKIPHTCNLCRLSSLLKHGSRSHSLCPILASRTSLTSSLGTASARCSTTRCPGMRTTQLSCRKSGGRRSGRRIKRWWARLHRMKRAVGAPLQWCCVLVGGGHVLC